MADSRWAKVGVIAGIVGAVAAVGALVIPTPLWEKGGGDLPPPVHGEGMTSGPVSSRTAVSEPPGVTSATSTGRVRYLAALPIVQGAGFVQVVGGSDLLMPCGSNQSDDRYREVEYELPGPYASFVTEVTVQGTADPETAVGVQLFIRERVDRSDRLHRVATVVAHPGEIKPLSADVASATALVIRLSCGSSDLRVRYAHPNVHG